VKNYGEFGGRVSRLGRITVRSAHPARLRNVLGGTGILPVRAPRLEAWATNSAMHQRRARRPAPPAAGDGGAAVSGRFSINGPVGGLQRSIEKRNTHGR